MLSLDAQTPERNQKERQGMESEDTSNEERDRQRLEALLDVAEAEISRGEGIPYTPELVAAMRRNVRKMVLEGCMPDPDVCP
jgi:hypothetical protein